MGMFPIMVAVWLGRNAGNANFLYNMTLVMMIFGSMLLSEWTRAGVRLRRRQHLSAFCKEVVIDALEKMLENPPARRAKEALVGDGDSTMPAAQAASASKDESLRRRR